MADLDYERWVVEALLSLVPRALTQVAEAGLPDGHALYVSFDPRHPGVEVDQTLAERHPELMTVVLENQFWDLATDDDGFSVVLAFGGRRQPLYVPWAAVRAFADPPAEFAFDTSGQISGGPRRLVGETVDDAGEGDAPAGEPDDARAEVDDENRFARRRDNDDSAAVPAGEVVPFARPRGTGRRAGRDADRSHESASPEPGADEPGDLQPGDGDRENEEE